MTIANGPETQSPKTLQQWLSQGEALYSAMLKEYQAIESQIAELENRLTAKQAEVNQIALLVGKPPLEGSRRLSAQLMTPYPPEPGARAASQLPRVVASNRPPRDPATREIIPPRT